MATASPMQQQQHEQQGQQLRNMAKAFLSTISLDRDFEPPPQPRPVTPTTTPTTTTSTTTTLLAAPQSAGTNSMRGRLSTMDPQRSAAKAFLSNISLSGGETTEDDENPTAVATPSATSTTTPRAAALVRRTQAVTERSSSSSLMFLGTCGVRGACTSVTFTTFRYHSALMVASYKVDRGAQGAPSYSTSSSSDPSAPGSPKDPPPPSYSEAAMGGGGQSGEGVEPQQLEREVSVSFGFLLNPTWTDAGEGVRYEMLDDPAVLKSGKHRTVMSLAGYRCSVVPYTKPAELKAELNQQFRNSCPHVAVSLSRIRRIKSRLLTAALSCGHELSSAAICFCLIDRLLKQGPSVVPDKSTFLLYAASCLYLAVKYNEMVTPASLRKLREVIEKAVGVPPSALLRTEFVVFEKVSFSLFRDPGEVLPYLSLIKRSSEVALATRQARTPT